MHDFAAEAPLLKRLLDGGADANAVVAKFGTPLETLAAEFTFGDVTLVPFYDVLLARPDLDLLQPGMGGRPVLVNLRKWSAQRGELAIRAEQTLTKPWDPRSTPGSVAGRGVGSDRGAHGPFQVRYCFRRTLNDT